MPKILNGIVSNKYDTSTNWAKATTFIPAKGETIYYKDPGMPIKFKVGDGVTLLSDLDFCTTDSEAIIVSNTAPSNTTKLWRSTVDNKLRYYNGTEWVIEGITYAAQFRDWREDI